jgi:hypothetical protein
VNRCLPPVSRNKKIKENKIKKNEKIKIEGKYIYKEETYLAK